MSERASPSMLMRLTCYFMRLHGKGGIGYAFDDWNTGAAAVAAARLLLFGPSKLPQLGRAVGTTLQEFRSSARHLTEEDEEKQNAGRRQEDH